MTDASREPPSEEELRWAWELRPQLAALFRACERAASRDDGASVDKIRLEINQVLAIALRAAHQRGREEDQEKLLQIERWCDAYPLKIFPEPDFDKAARVLMAIYDWTTASQATIYTRAADRKRLAADAMPLLAAGAKMGTG